MVELGKYFSTQTFESHIKHMLIGGEVKSVVGIEHLNGLKYAIIMVSDANLEPFLQLKTVESVLIQTYTKINDITPLKNVQTINIIDTTIDSNQLKEFSGLKSFYMFSSDENMNDLTLKNLKNNKELVSLSIESGNLKNIGELKNFKKLSYLSLNDNEVKDIQVLKHLHNLKELSIGSNDISDIAVLKELPNITELLIEDNEIDEISVLLEMPNLQLVYLEGNPINQDGKSIIEELENRGVKVIID